MPTRTSFWTRSPGRTWDASATTRSLGTARASSCPRPRSRPVIGGSGTKTMSRTRRYPRPGPGTQDDEGRHHRHAQRNHPVGPRDATVLTATAPCHRAWRETLCHPAMVCPVTSAVLDVVRPRQWVKNLLVVAAPLAAGALLVDDVGRDTIVAFVAFWLASSATYCLNDVLDAEADATHPTKRRRPIPSGRVSPRTALVLSGLLAGAAWRSRSPGRCASWSSSTSSSPCCTRRPSSTSRSSSSAWSRRGSSSGPSPAVPRPGCRSRSGSSSSRGSARSSWSPASGLSELTRARGRRAAARRRPWPTTRCPTCG